MDERQQIAITEFVSARTPRPLMGPVLTFDLAEEAGLLRQEEPWRLHGHNARTLIKNSEFRLVQITLQAGARAHEQQTDERLALHVIRGRLRLHIPTEVMELRAEQLVMLDRRVPYSIEALEDTDFLLWLGWSKD
jgi:quercetin dioxygenase-like cupin family protein